MGNNNPYN